MTKTITPATQATQVASRAPARIMEFTNTLNANTENLKGMLGSSLNVEMFKSHILTAVLDAPELLDCDFNSLLSACRKAANDGCVPDGREGKIIPRSVGGKKVAGWQLMIGGVRKKVRQSGEVTSFKAELVHQRDIFHHTLGLQATLEHIPFQGSEKDRGPVIFVYAVAKLKNEDEAIFEVMHISDVLHIRDTYSDGWKAFKEGKIKTTPWDSAPGEMAKKTVALRLAKVLPMSTDTRRSITEDDDFSPPSGDANTGQVPARTRPNYADYQENGGAVIDGKAEPVADTKPEKEKAPATYEEKIASLLSRLEAADVDAQNEIWDLEVEPNTSIKPEDMVRLRGALKAS